MRINTLVALSAVLMSACAPLQGPSGDVELSIPTTTGTRLPSNPEKFVDKGFTTAKEVMDIFGEPQIVNSYEWGRVLTYRYQEKDILGQKFDEYVEFAFSSRGFLKDVVKYSGPTIISKDNELKAKKECPPQFTLCQSYQASKG